MIQAIHGGDIFDGVRLLANHAVLVEAGRIAAVLPASDIPDSAADRYDLRGGCLLPGFVDLQVNGGGGALFSAEPDPACIRTMGAAHRRFGTTGFLPTLISNDYETMRRAIAGVGQAMREGVPGVLGIHLEGPFLNPAKSGAHDAGRMRELDEEGFGILTSLESGVTLVTLAPEVAGPVMIRRLTEEGVIVCAGHSMADYRLTVEALDAGVRGFTHLYNAMTPLTSREPGMVGAAIEDEDSWFGIIADGHHVDPAALRVAVRAKRTGGAVLVTDAMPSVGCVDKTFTLGDETIQARGGKILNAAGALAGSDLDMLAAVNNAAEFAGIDWLEAIRMASLYPARALGLGDELGRIHPGCRANLLALDSDRGVAATWIDGCLD